MAAPAGPPIRNPTPAPINVPPTAIIIPFSQLSCSLTALHTPTKYRAIPPMIAPIAAPRAAFPKALPMSAPPAIAMPTPPIDSRKFCRFIPSEIISIIPLTDMTNPVTTREIPPARLNDFNEFKFASSASFSPNFHPIIPAPIAVT